MLFGWITQELSKDKQRCLVLNKFQNNEEMIKSKGYYEEKFLDRKSVGWGEKQVFWIGRKNYVDIAE